MKILVFIYINFIAILDCISTGCASSLGGHLYFRVDLILLKGLSKHPKHIFSRHKNRPEIRVFVCFFLNFVVISFPKFVNMTKNTPVFSNFVCFCIPKRCKHVHCLVLTNNPNYMNFFTRMISNFKYKCPPPHLFLCVWSARMVP